MLGSRVACNVRRTFSSLASPQPEPSLLDSMFGRSKMPKIPLNSVFPNVKALQPTLSNEGAVKLTTLENGLRVVSLDSNSSITSAGVFIDSGSRFENAENSGISHFLEYFACGSTKNRSDFKIVRDLLSIGANTMCSTSREHTVYAIDSLREHAASSIGIVADIVQNPIFDIDELHDAHKQYKVVVKDKSTKADTQIMEAIHAAAYYNNTLGLPLYANEHQVESFSEEVLSNHIRKFYIPQRMVVSAVGLEHEQLLALVKKNFDLDTQTANFPVEKAKYTGGDVRISATDLPMFHMALAFETVNWHSKDIAAMCVLQMMMGGGGAFSAGGPGKGMYSRLYQNVLNGNGWVESAHCFNSIFSDSSIFGIYGTCLPTEAQDLGLVLVEEFHKMAGPVTEEELARSKTQLKTSVLMQLETRSQQLEDLGRQILTFGKYDTAQSLCNKIDAVTASDVQRVARDMMKTTPSLALSGNLSHAPRYDVIARHFAK